MRLTRRQLRQLIIEEITRGSLLAEEEKNKEKKKEPDPTDAEDLFSDTEDEDTSDSSTNEPEAADSDAEGDAPADSEADSTDDSDESEEEDAVTPEEAEEQAEKAAAKANDATAKSLGPITDAIDDQLQKAEDLASIKSESIFNYISKVGFRIQNKSLANILFEADINDNAPELNVFEYARSVLNLIENYSSILDLESLIYKAAYDRLLNKYGEPVADEFESQIKKLSPKIEKMLNYVRDPEKANQTVYGVGSKKPEGA